MLPRGSSCGYQQRVVRGCEREIGLCCDKRAIITTEPYQQSDTHSPDQGRCSMVVDTGPLSLCGLG